MMFELYKRWRHTHGFGVHSPFAYHIVTTAISPGRRYGYYGYAAIDEALDAYPLTRDNRYGLPPDINYRHLRRIARILLRLAVALDASHILLPPDAHPALRAAARAAVPEASPSGALCKRVMTGEVGQSSDPLIILSQNPNFQFSITNFQFPTLLLHSKGQSPDLPPFSGITLCARHFTILLPRPQTAHTQYKII